LHARRLRRHHERLRVGRPQGGPHGTPGRLDEADGAAPAGATRGLGAQIVADRLAVRVQRVRLCRPAVVEGVVHQKVEDRTTQYDVLSMLGGLVVAGAGAGLLANVDDFSDTPGVDENGEENASSKDMAEVWGWVGVVGGALWALHGVSVAARAGAHDLPDARKDEEERPTGGIHAVRFRKRRLR
jgi:hypothetical protein